MTVIQMIPIKKLKQHPKNVRLEYPDIEELAESIKAKGVLQNLTVVKDPEGTDGYLVVIGNRRLAAAQLAGIDELPCSIVEMSEEEQITTMLTENMQRNDLSVYEQAKGVQMCIEDFGLSVSEVAKRTGLSEPTVRHRVRMTELPDDLLKEKSSSATIKDFIDLEQVKDKERKNRLAESLGTPSFRIELNRAIEDEAKAKRREEGEKALDVFAEKVDRLDYSRTEWVRSGWWNEKDDYSEPDDTITGIKYYFTASDYSWTLYKEKSIPTTQITEEDEAEARKVEERRLKNEKWGELDKLTRKTILDFMTKTTPGRHPMDPSNINKWIVMMLLREDVAFEDIPKWFNLDEDIYEGLSGISTEEPEEILKKTTQTDIENIIFSLVCDDISRCKKWDCSYEESKTINTMYLFLKDLGYEVSDLEKSLMDGSHEIYEHPERS